MDTPATSTDPTSYYAMPPVGMTTTRANLNGRTIHSYTVRCGSINCWFVGHGGTSQDAQFVLDEHKCPTLPTRNELPSGRSTLEKLWDEMDDVTAALIDGHEYNGMSVDTLKGYAKGLAFNLSMMTHPYFRTIKDIAREAGARYKMSKGTTPWRPTPSYRYNPTPEVLTANVVSTVPTEKRTPTKRTPVKSAPKPINLEPANAAAIRAGLGSGMFSMAELAEMYGVTVEQVRVLSSK